MRKFMTNKWIIILFALIICNSANAQSRRGRHTRRKGSLPRKEVKETRPSDIVISKPENENKPESHPVSSVRTYTVNGVSFNMVHVQGGNFKMGATPEQAELSDDNESPVHNVTLTSFMIGQTEVTQELWTAVMRENPSIRPGEQMPVDNISWDDCQAFILKLNQMTGQQFHLPTEAQWEYAAKGGHKHSTTIFSGADLSSTVGWCDLNSEGKTHIVGTKAPNTLGIYDMTGNIQEWCEDWYGIYEDTAQTNPSGATSGAFRILRGGSWGQDSRFCRVTYRSRDTPNHRGAFYGMRLAL